MSEEQRTYTRDEVTGAVNKGADLVLGDEEIPPPPPRRVQRFDPGPQHRGPGGERCAAPARQPRRQP